MKAMHNFLTEFNETSQRTLITLGQSKIPTRISLWHSLKKQQLKCIATNFILVTISYVLYFCHANYSTVSGKVRGSVIQLMSTNYKLTTEELFMKTNVIQTLVSFCITKSILISIRKNY